jgi:hypothetical protein
MEVAVCPLHRDELAGDDPEWMLTNDVDGRRLYVGTSLRQLNEYLLLEPPNTVRGYAQGAISATPRKVVCTYLSVCAVAATTNRKSRSY